MTSLPHTPGRRTGRPRAIPDRDTRPPREVILAVASRLFGERGVADTTLTEIARRAGLRTSSLYYYFEGKEAMLHAIVDEVNRLTLDRLAAINADGGRPAVRLFRLICFDVRSLCTLPYDVNEVLRLPALQEPRFAQYWRDRQDLNDAVESLVVEGVDVGDFGAVDVRLCALTILANDEGVQNWYRPLGEHRIAGRDDPDLGPYTPDEIGRHLARMAVGDLLRDRRSLRSVEARARRLDERTEAAAGADGAVSGDGGGGRALPA